MRASYNQKGRERGARKGKKKKKKGATFQAPSPPPEHFTQGTAPRHFFPDIIRWAITQSVQPTMHHPFLRAGGW